MDWDHLRVFLAVARHGQLLAAARALGLNHATIARRLDALEADLGVRLFERRPSGCVPTQAGERLLPVADGVERELHTAFAELREQEVGLSGRVRVGAPDGLGNYVLAAILGELARLHPKLIVELVPLPRTFSLPRREADIAIALDEPREGRMHVSRLVDYTLGVYASADYLARQGTPASLEALEAHTVVTGVEEFAYASALDYAASLERHAGSIFRCASVVGQVEAVRGGVGVGILHDFAAAGVSGLTRILPGVAFRRSYFLLLHPESSGIARVGVVRDFIIRRFRQQRPRFAPSG